MKKYRPYSKTTSDMRGMWVKGKDNPNMSIMITGIDEDCSEEQIALQGNWVSLQHIFDTLTYLDGTPFGECYEEEVVLMKGKPYLVRNHDNYIWSVKYFNDIFNTAMFFYIDEATQTSAANDTTDSSVEYKQVCEYYDNEHLKGTINEPKEYLIKQS